MKQERGMLHEVATWFRRVISRRAVFTCPVPITAVSIFFFWDKKWRDGEVFKAAAIYMPYGKPMSLRKCRVEVRHVCEDFVWFAETYGDFVVVVGLLEAGGRSALGYMVTFIAKNGLRLVDNLFPRGS